MSKVHTSPPHSKDSEMIALGCMLISSTALSIGADQLEEADFYLPEHRHIFQALKRSFCQEKPADLHLISEELKKLNLLDSAGGIAYLTSLVQFAGTSSYMEEYVEILQKKSILRQMIESARNIEKNALKEPDDVFAYLDEAQSCFFRISQKMHSSVGISIKDWLSGEKSSCQQSFLKQLQERQEAFLQHGKENFEITGLPSGFLDLDKLLNGFSPSNLIILASRPSMGKTALSLNIAEYLAFQKKISIGIFSLEMTADEIIHRMICSQAEVESERIKLGSLNGTEYQHIVQAVKNMQQCSLVIDDQPGMKITDLRARARRLKESYNPQLIIIDYLQLLSGSRTYSHIENRQTEIAEISRCLKNLARELHIPILCLSQLSRKVEDRSGHKPLLSDLRESGSLEQDADIVLLIFRHDYYNPKEKPGLAEIIIAKNRHGKVGEVELAFRKQFAKFNSLARKNSNMHAQERNPFADFSPKN